MGRYLLIGKTSFACLYTHIQHSGYTIGSLGQADIDKLVKDMSQYLQKSAH